MDDPIFYEPELVDVILRAFDRFWIQSKESGFHLSQHIKDWMRDYFQTDHPEEAFIRPRSFPVLLLPWLAEKNLKVIPDHAFQTDLVYSTVNGYFYIRVIDNLLDRHRPQDLKLLPALNLFHTQFQSPYSLYFGYDHPFWDQFRSVWFRSAEATLRDAELRDIELDTFVNVCAQKTIAAQIPVMAVFFRYGNPDRYYDWRRFIELFGCWHQMWNDIFDWVKDTRQTTVTYFLSEAERCKKGNEPVVDWVIREGFDWGMAHLDSWMSDLKDQARQLGSPELEHYLVERNKSFENQRARFVDELRGLDRLLSAVKSALNVDGM